jgi:hypothetical protein
MASSTMDDADLIVAAHAYTKATVSYYFVMIEVELIMKEQLMNLLVMV